MVTSALASGGVLQSTTTAVIASGGVLTAAASTSVLASGGVLSSAAVTTRCIASGGYLAAGQVEPFRTINLPAGTWTQTAGPTIAPPTVLAPGVQGGTTLSYTQTNGTEFDYLIIPQTIFYRPSTSVLKAVRKTPA